MATKRESGILLHPTALPSMYGVGDLGSTAYKFVDFLHNSGQSMWQMLPLGPTGYGNSPYQTHSAFAGSHILISLELLVEDGLITLYELPDPHLDEDKVEYDAVIAYKYRVLTQTYYDFKAKPNHPYHQKYEQFCERESAWLEDYALFISLKEHHDDAPWNKWSQSLRERDRETLRIYREKLADAIALHKFIQFLFYYQFELLHDYAKQKGIQLIGDIPIFVAHDSSDVWSHPEWFLLEESGEPRVVAGVPPDYFSATGQRWGNPLYDWEQIKADAYSFWIDRFAHTARMFDLVRIDHFRGFVDYWEIPADEKTAINGKWCKGPGLDLFRALESALGKNLPIVAEDLGIITEAVVTLVETLGYPGMAVLQFGFQSMQSDDPSAFLPHNLKQNQVVYTGTHDNDTLKAWWQEQTPEVQKFTKQYLNTDAQVIHRDFIRTALGTICQRAIFPMQDLLGLGSEAKMNRPGTTEGNWQWRMRDDALNPALERDLLLITKLYGRA